WTGALLEKSFQGGEVLADRGLDARRRQALQREEIAQVELPAVVDPSPASDRPELDVAMKGRPVPRKRGHGERGGSLVDGDGEPLTIGAPGLLVRRSHRDWSRGDLADVLDVVVPGGDVGEVGKVGEDLLDRPVDVDALREADLPITIETL